MNPLRKHTAGCSSPSRRHLLRLLTGAAALAAPALRANESFLTRPVTLWVPWPAGGARQPSAERRAANAAGLGRSSLRSLYIFRNKIFKKIKISRFYYF